MNDYPSNVKQKLNSIIADMSEHHWLFSNNPGHDFMRQHQGKLSFYDTMRLIIGMGKGTTNDEIMDYFDMVPDLIPSQSAFNQRRGQISLSAFEYLLSEFSSSFPATTNKFKDHCILACDGCHVVYTTNSEIIEDYNKPRLIDYKGYNHMHLNGFVDVISKAFLDIVIQPGQKPDERQAFHMMLDHFSPDNPQKYLRRSFYGEYSLSGVPFLDWRCDLQSDHLIVYGHNMKNGSMFGFLKKLRRDEKANKTAVQYMDKNFLHQNNFCSPGAYCVKQEEHTDAERSAVFKA